MDDFETLLSTLEQSQGLPKGVLKSLMMAESSGRSNAVSPIGAKGAFQMMPKTEAAYGGGDPFVPASQAKDAARYLGMLYKQSGGDLKQTLAKWNEGPGAFQKRGGMEHLPEETQKFIPKVEKGMGVNGGSMPIQTPNPQQTQQSQQSSAMTPDQLKAGMQDINQQQEAENKKYQEEAQKQLDAMQLAARDVPEYKSATIPEYKPAPPFKADEFNDFASSIVAMAALGGAFAGHARGLYWMNSIQSLNEAANMWMQGKYKESVDKREEFDRQFKVAMEQQKQYHEEYMSILENKKISLGEMRDQMNFLATVHHDEGAMLAAQKNDLYHLAELGNKREEFQQNLQQKKDQLMERINHDNADIEMRKQRIHESVNHITSLSQPAKDQLSAMQMGLMDIDGLIKTASENPEVLKAANRLPGVSNSAELEMAYKSGAFDISKYVTADPGTQLYTQQVQFWREMDQMVERYTSATMKQRSMAAIQFMRSLKAQVTDRPDVAMAVMKDFRKNMMKELYDTVSIYDADPHHKIYAEAALTGSGYTMQSLKSELQQVGGWQSPEQKQQELKSVNQPQTAAKKSIPQLNEGQSTKIGGREYKKLSGKVYSHQIGSKEWELENG